MGQQPSLIYGEDDVDRSNFPGEKAPELSSVGIPVYSSAITFHDGHWQFLDSHRNIRLLNKGATLFAFCCKPGDDLNAAEKNIVDSVINITGFEDEVKDNNAPLVDIFNPDEGRLYTTIITKVHYLLKDIVLDDITPEMLADRNYHMACQPGNPTVWDEVPDNTTFRITKNLIPYVYDMTIQFKVHEVHESYYKQLAELDCTPVHKAVILERTKRHKNIVDATRKVKSVLIYNSVPDGVHCMNITVVLNTSLPNFIAPFIDGLGSFGSTEAAQTAQLTREYLRHKSVQNAYNQNEVSSEAESTNKWSPTAGSSSGDDFADAEETLSDSECGSFLDNEMKDFTTKLEKTCI
eukprot:CFRG4929T1